MNFSDLVQQRRSHRKFTGEEVSAEDVKQILRAALMSPTSKGQRAWQFVVVDDKTELLWCWVTPCRTTAGWRMAVLPPSPCSIRLRNWDWAPAGCRCVVADSLTVPLPIPLYRAFSISLRTCRASACWPLATGPTSASHRLKTV